MVLLGCTNNFNTLSIVPIKWLRLLKKFKYVSDADHNFHFENDHPTVHIQGHVKFKYVIIHGNDCLNNSLSAIQNNLIQEFNLPSFLKKEISMYL